MLFGNAEVKVGQVTRIQKLIGDAFEDLNQDKMVHRIMKTIKNEKHHAKKARKLEEKRAEPENHVEETTAVTDQHNPTRTLDSHNPDPRGPHPPSHQEPTDPAFVTDLARMLVACDIPLYKTEIPAFRAFLERWAWMKVPPRAVLAEAMSHEIGNFLAKRKKRLLGVEQQQQEPMANLLSTDDFEVNRQNL